MNGKLIKSKKKILITSLFPAWFPRYIPLFGVGKIEKIVFFAESFSPKIELINYNQKIIER